MSYKILEKQYADGIKLVARVKLPNGKWRQYPTYQTDVKKAEKVARRIVKALAEGEEPNAFGQRNRGAGVPLNKQITLAVMIETYLEEKHSSWAPGTFPGYQIPLILFRDFLGDVNVSQIRSTDLLEFRKFLLRRGCTRHKTGDRSWKPLKPKTLRNYEGAIQFFLTWSGKRLGFSPPKLDLVPMPRTQPLKYWRPDECVDLLRAAHEIVVHGQPYSLYLGFLFSTGMRKTEAALTRWEWLDLDTRSIKLPGVDPETGQRITKNGQWRLFLMSEKSGHISDNFERTIERANRKRRAEGKTLIPRLTPHSTRHTYAVQSLQAGMDLFALAQILGHATTDTTMKHYAMLALPELHRQVTKAGSFHAAMFQGLFQTALSEVVT
ncbi:MAG: tyrosine-type recombinase/integrase [bacterium]|nr:tyrosine-type recombinase/integrase [bacterium]